MRKTNALSALFFLIFFSTAINSKEFNKNCSWDNTSNTCVEIKKFSNSSDLSDKHIRVKTIYNQDIKNSGAIDLIDALQLIPEVSITRSGPTGQQASVFLRGTNSNHTLVLINGIPINDQSTTQGLHDFGVDFVQSIQKIEVYLGANASQFGTNAIGGAINIILNGDYKDQVNFNFDKNQNYNFMVNKNFFKDSEILNLKISGIDNRSISAISGVNDDLDGVKNITFNSNYERWLDDNTKIFNTSYIRKTLSEYDNSGTNQHNYESDNNMFTSQFGLSKHNKDLKKKLVLYYTGYNRAYDENGIKDNYYSNVIGGKYDYSIKKSNTLSYGYGLDYKYDWANFKNRGSYSASTKGNSENFAIFGNAGTIFKNNNIGIFFRSDNHKQTGINNSYHIDINRKIKDKIITGTSRKTAYRTPTLYELYGTDNYGYSGNKDLRPEKSSTNEIYTSFKLTNKSDINFTAFRSSISNNIEYVSNKYVNDDDDIDLNQSGYDLNYKFSDINTSLNIFFSSIKSKDESNKAQLRRPNKNYGLNYNKKIFIGKLLESRIHLDYKHYGQHLDTHSSTFNTVEMDSTDIVNVKISKNIKNKIFHLKISNLLKETFQQPHGFNQDGRRLFFGISSEIK